MKLCRNLKVLFGIQSSAQKIRCRAVGSLSIGNVSAGPDLVRSGRRDQAIRDGKIQLYVHKLKLDVVKFLSQLPALALEIRLRYVHT
jgi:hypothetical protein